MYNIFFILYVGLLSHINAQNVAVTSFGIAVAAVGSRGGGLVLQQNESIAPVAQFLPDDVLSFEDVSFDAGNDSLVFALSIVSQRACSFLLSTDNEALTLINCVGEGDNFSVRPFCGVSALDGTLIISGGTGGMTIYQYDSASGLISDTPSVFNLDSRVVGHPDVLLLDANLAALSTDFNGVPRFGTQIVSIEGASVNFVRDFRVQDSLGFNSNISPANFPLVNAVYKEGSKAYMYTANGPMQVQNPRSDDTPNLLCGASDGFSAVTVSVNTENKIAVFGGLSSSGASTVLVYDLSVDPRNPSLISSIPLVDQRITSIASGGNLIAYTTQGSSTISYVLLPIEATSSIMCTLSRSSYVGVDWCTLIPLFWSFCALLM